MNMLITRGRGRWGVVSPLCGRGRPKIPTPSLSGNGAPSRGAGPPVPRVSSALLAARQSLHTLPLSGNPSCSGSGDGTGEGCPWDTRTHAEGQAPSCDSPACGRLHFSDSRSVGHVGGGGSSGRKPGLPTSPAPGPVPWTRAPS